MSELKQKANLIKKRIVKSFQWLLVAILIPVAILIAISQLPYLQNMLLKKFTQQLSRDTQFSIQYQKFQFKWFQEAFITGLEIKDPSARTMLFVDHLVFEINPIHILLNKSITIEEAKMAGAQVHIIKNDDEAFNSDVFIQKIKTMGQQKATRHKTPRAFVIKRVFLKNVAFLLDNQRIPPLQDRFDLKHIKLNQIEAQLTNLRATAGTIEMNIDQLTCNHVNSPLSIVKLHTFFRISQTGMEFTQLNLQTEHSHIKDTILFTYAGTKALSQFVDSVEVNAHLDNSVIHTSELAIFVPYFKQYDTHYSLSGSLKGKVKDFHIADLNFNFGQQNSRVKGNVSLKGLPNFQKVFIKADLATGKIATTDISPYIGEQHYKAIEKLRYLAIKGNFVGSPQDFAVAGTLDTDLGTIRAAINLKRRPSPQYASYKGVIAVNDFALGTLLNAKELQKLTMDGQIEGKGLTLETADFQLKARVGKLGLHHYEYKNIYTNGSFTKERFQGSLTINDPHLKFEANTDIDLSDGKDVIAIHGSLATASLKALHIMNKKATLRTKFAIALRGLSLDKVMSNATFSQLSFHLEDKYLDLDMLHIYTDSATKKRIFIDAPPITIKAEGDFSYTTLIKDVRQLVRKYTSFFTNAKQSLEEQALQEYCIDYSIHLKDINPLLSLFTSAFYIAPNTILQGSFSQHQQTTFSLYTSQIDSLAFKKNRFIQPYFEFTASKSADHQEVVAWGQFTATKQEEGAPDATTPLLVDVLWKNDQINFRSALGQDNSQNQIDLKGSVALFGSITEIKLTPSILRVLDREWQIHPQNLIILANSSIKFKDFSLFSDNQKISLTGVISSEPTETLHLHLENFLLSNFNPILSCQLAGKVNGSATLQNISQKSLIESNILVKDCLVNNFLVGDVTCQTNREAYSEKLNIVFEVERLKKKIVHIVGCYNPVKTKNSLQLTVNFSNTQLSMLEPFVDTLFSQLDGTLNGTINIKGSLTDPQITGNGKIRDATLRINYLNTRYGFAGDLVFSSQAIHVTNLKLSDDQAGRATLTGAVFHEKFTNFTLDLQGIMTKFKVLNTTFKDNQEFYGNGIVSGPITLSGPVSNLTIQAKATTEEGTRIYIPMKKDNTAVRQEEYIKFISFEDQVKGKVAPTRSATLKGLKLSLALEVTRDAYTELILDMKNGDIISGKGDGTINLEIDTKGAFNMNGDYVFAEGGYNFSIYKLIGRKFKILPESRITWYGHPHTGLLNIKATYEQRISLAPLLLIDEAEINADPDYRKKYPVQVILKLQGEILSPQLDFEVNFQEYPYNTNMQTAIDAFQAKIATDERYLADQVFSLIILKRFTAEEQVNTQGKDVGRSLSEFFSSRLSSIASELDKNLEVDVDIDLTELDKNLQLRLAYTFLEGRLRIAKEGTVGSSHGREATTTTALIGDWTVEYILTKDGQLTARMYSKSISDPVYLGTHSTPTIVGGFSIKHVKHFNRWKEIFKGKKKEVK